MSKLSERVEKSKGLVYSHNPYFPGRWSTWGGKDSNYGEKYYYVDLSHKKETVNTPDGQKIISVFEVGCRRSTNGVDLYNCPGNEHNTVCYHGLGAIYRSFEQAKSKKLVAFYETYEAASRMSFGGKVAKVQSANGGGHLWCTIRDWPLSVQDNINLMRGQEDDEGID